MTLLPQMLQFKEFSAWITIEGSAAEQFNVEVSEDGQRVSCWIPSQIGKTFQVHWKDSVTSTQTKGEVLVDGNYCHNKVISHPHKVACSTGFRESATRIRPYVFSKMDFTDDDAYLGSSLHGGTGGIELVITRIQRLQGEQIRFKTTDTPKQYVVHERAKKGLDHQIKFGESVQDVAKTFKYTTIGGPVVTFCFKYRPIDVLRANGIAPQPPRANQKRKASEDDNNDEVDDVKGEEASDDDEIKDMKAKLAAALEAKKRNNPSKKVKREEVKREKITEEVIDLT